MKALTIEQSKALNLERHISLTANAGSGKTFVLSKRFIEIALLPNVLLQNICAITFTEKAASELYKKISVEIDKRISEETDLAIKRKLQFIRRQLVSANISTIHSFCIGILREHPVESGIDANFTAIDQNESAELIELSIQEAFIQSHSKTEEENLKYLIRTFSSKDILQKELTSLINNRKNVLSVKERIYKNSEVEIADFFSDVFNKKIDQIFLNNIDDIINAVDKINSSVLRIKNDNEKAIEVNAILQNIKQHKSNANLQQLLQNLLNTLITTSGTLYKRGYLADQSGLENEIKYVEEISEDYRKLNFDENSKINSELARFGKILLDLFEKCLSIYSNKKKEQGLLDFEDILLFTKNILENESVQNALGEKYKFVMVDEYQDTNEIQYHIFLPIVDHLKKNNLFVVGDEKQSIYMFRDAELEVFDKTKSDIKKQSGMDSILELPHSFRMAPELAAFTNELFSRLFSSPNINFNEVSYSEIICAREEEVTGRIEILFAQKMEDDLQPASQAILVKNKLIQLSNQKDFKWGDCAILVRKRKSFADLENVFQDANIPFTILGGKGFYQQQIVYDIYNFFSFLIDQKNDTALIGLLRSPFFLLPDSTLFDISCSDGYYYFDKIKSYAEKNTEIQNIVNKLKSVIKLVYNFSSPEILARILSDSYFLSVINSRKNGHQDIANLKKLIKLSLEFHSKGFTTIYDYINYLSNKIETGADESQAALNDESNSVKILTIHQAKGLEFRNVFLYKCEETPQNDFVKTRSITFSKEFGIITKLFQDDNFFAEAVAPPIAELNNIIVRKKNIAELKRLFYVAVTRAMDSLYICCEKCPENKNTFIGLLQDAFGVIEEKETLYIESNLKRFASIDNKMETKTLQIKLNIPILRKIELSENSYHCNEEVNTNKFNINIDRVDSVVSGEMISATKLLTFMDCPFKYYLKYELGYDNLVDFSVQIDNDDHSQDHSQDGGESNETIITSFDPEKNIAQAKGKIIHKLLQLELTPEETIAAIDTVINSELGAANLMESLKNEIQATLEPYFNSSAYKEIKTHLNQKNEFEVFYKEGDYFLTGIIDKIIFLDRKIIIIDYKTDNVNEENIVSKAEHYLNQLKFYFYIVSGLYKNINDFELRLIFLKQLDKKFLIELKQKDRLKFGVELKKILSALQLKSYFKERKHCHNCNFSSGQNQCIHD